jgi:hypothetical protein
MKIMFLVLLWLAVTFLTMLSLYRFVPPETQYAMAEYFGFYGDERVMDFVLYSFFAIAISIASASTFCAFLLLRK